MKNKILALLAVVALSVLGFMSFSGPALAKAPKDPAGGTNATQSDEGSMPMAIAEISVGPPRKISVGWIVLTNMSDEGPPPTSLPGQYKSDPPVGQAYPYYTFTFYDDGTYDQTQENQPPIPPQTVHGTYK